MLIACLSCVVVSHPTTPQADVIFVNTCAVRDNAESKVWQRLNEFRAMRRKGEQRAQVGVLGCMAERLKSKLLEVRGNV